MDHCPDNRVILIINFIYYYLFLNFISYFWHDDIFSIDISVVDVQHDVPSLKELAHWPQPPVISDQVSHFYHHLHKIV